MSVYPAGVAPLDPDAAGRLPVAACAYEATATNFQNICKPVAGAPDMTIRRLLMVVVPPTVTANTRFLIHEKFVPVAVGIATGVVVPVAVSSRLKEIPPSAFAHDTLAPVPACPCVVAAAKIVLLYDSGSKALFSTLIMNRVPNRRRSLIVRSPGPCHCVD